MATYGYSDRRRRFNFTRIAGAVACLTIIVTIGLFVRVQLLNKNIASNKAKIETLTEKNVQVEQETKAMQDEIKTLEEEATKIEELLWRYEPVVIPDSMK